MTAYMDYKDLANETIDEARAGRIADGVHRVLDRIARAEMLNGREEGSVTLLAATKTRDVGEIMAAIDAGVHMIGENRPQEIAAKIDGLRYACGQRGIVLGANDVETVESLDLTDDPEALDHLPLLDNAAGVRLAKRVRSLDLGHLREQGVRPQAVVGYCAWALGLVERPRAMDAPEALACFDWRRACAVRGRDLKVPDDIGARLLAM